jgi:hypothetical protein
MEKELNGKYPAQIEADQQRKNQLLEWWMDYLQGGKITSEKFEELTGINVCSSMERKMLSYWRQFNPIEKWASDKLQVMFAEESLEILIKEFQIL